MPIAVESIEAAHAHAAHPPRAKPAPPVSAAVLPAIYLLKNRFTTALAQWASVPQAPGSGMPASHYALARCTSALELIENAIALLADRKGERASAARVWLEERRAAITSAIEAFHGFGADFSGDEARRLAGRITEVREASDAAEAAYASATPDSLSSALLAREHARLADRDLGIEFARALASLAVPPLPSAEYFTLAEASTRDLERKPSKAPACAAVADAITQGLTAAPDVARLWVVYEAPAPAPHSLIEWRARAAAEARGR